MPSRRVRWNSRWDRAVFSIRARSPEPVGSIRAAALRAEISNRRGPSDPARASRPCSNLARASGVTSAERALTAVVITRACSVVKSPEANASRVAA